MKALSEKQLSDADVLRHLTEVLRQSRRVEADLVFLIGEVDARRLYARDAVSSTFAYCTEILHLSEPETGLRLHVARTCAKHPMLLEMLRDGRLHLSAIAMLAPHLTAANREKILKRALHKSKRELEQIVAELKPRPEARAVVRRLPAPAKPRPDDAGPPSRTAGSVGSTVPAPEHLPDDVERAGSAGGRVAAVEHRPDDVAAPSALASAPPSRAEAVAPARVRLHLTVTAELYGKIERLQALMSSSVPVGDLGAIIDAAVTEKLERLEAKRFGKTKRPRKTLAETDTTPSSRHVPAAVRRAVHVRDKGQCTYVDSHERRCKARDRLEFHHDEVPFGRGGAHTVTNVRLMCRTHNTLLAERVYGAEKMERHRRAGKRISQGATLDTRVRPESSRDVPPP